MTALENVADGQADRPHPLLRGVSAAAVHAWLLPEDQKRFVSEFQAAMDEASKTLELSVVHDVVERWRQMAVLQTDPHAFIRTARRLAEVATGIAPADDEPFHVTRANAGI